MSSQGPYQYYEPPPLRQPGDSRRSFADHEQTLSPMPRSSKTTAARGAQGGQSGLRIDPNAVPDNLRAAAWSPDMMSPRTRSTRHRTRADYDDATAESPSTVKSSVRSPDLQTSSAHAPRRQMSDRSPPTTGKFRRGSIPDRSPLQQLETVLTSKEEKRARLEQAETRARQKSLGQTDRTTDGELSRRETVRSDRGRVVSDGDRPAESRKRSEKSVQSPAIMSPNQPRDIGATKFRKASEELKQSPPVQANGHSTDRHGRVAMTEDPKTDARVPSSARNTNNERQTASVTRSASGAGDVNRTMSGKYKHRARDAGFAGAAAAMAGAGIAPHENAADRGKAAHEKRRSLRLTADSPRSSPITSAPSQRDGKYMPQQQYTGDMDGNDRQERQMGSSKQNPEPSSVEQSALPTNSAINYKIPPQTEAGQQARQQIGFGSAEHAVSAPTGHHRFGGLLHRGEHRSYQPSTKPLEEWRTAKTARLRVEDLELDDTSSDTGARREDLDSAWWEKKERRATSGGYKSNTAQYDGPYEEEAKHFKPPLYLKCGPLLRYTGMRTEAGKSSRNSRTPVEREIWRGSVMIVTHNDQSDYAFVPILRLFAQQMDLLPSLPRETTNANQQVPLEHEDPIAGQVKLSRTGRPLFVRPVHDIDGEVDLSRVENPQGLYAATRTPALGPQNMGESDASVSRQISFQNKSRIKGKDGEKLGRYREVRGVRLHAERGCTFWRFNIEVELGRKQNRVAYRINKGPAVGFWVPARGETMNIMFHSCNGFSLSVDSHSFSGPDPLWRDVLNRHQRRPFHVMLGGGDQIYNDAAMRDTDLFREWLATKNPEHKHSADFTPDMQNELETFYLDRYAMWFSQGLFAMANSQIPMVNMWDDHDIIDGFGSYPHHFMSSRVFTGLGAVAFKYYMLFQHQSLVAETENEEPCWLLGASPGPYINELSRSLFMNLGRKVVFLGLDCRTERMRDEILSQDSYDIIFDRCRDEIYKGETKHLIVLLGVPIAYPRLNFLENILTSKVMDPIKALGRTGMLGGFVNKFDGGVEILDDLDDHWTAKHHKAERNWFIQELQELAAEKSVRVTILGGDVHLGAVGQFYTQKLLGVGKDKDHRYMPNVISSAIVNTPPPTMMADVLNRRNKIHHLDEETDEDLIPMFDTDVDGTKRNNKHLLPRRNYCTIREYTPGTTPPPSPRLESRKTFDGSFRDDDKRYPPGSMMRTMSLNNGPANLIRRLSGSGRSKPTPRSLAPDHIRPYSAQSQNTASPMQRSASLGSTVGNRSFDAGQTAPRPGIYRRPTNMSIKEARKAAAKGGADGNLDGREAGLVDLEGGLDVSLNMEIDQRDPIGATVPYRLLIPALWYEGVPDVNTARFKGRRTSLMQRIRGRLAPGQQKYEHDAEQNIEEENEKQYDGSPNASPPPNGRASMQMSRPQKQQAHPGGLDSSPAPRPASNRNSWQPPSGTAYEETDGYDNPNNVTSNRPPAISGQVGRTQILKHQDPRHIPNMDGAYRKGFDLSSPPVGGGTHAPAVNNNPYQQSGYRRTSGPGQRPHPGAQSDEQRWDHDDDDFTTEGSLTPEPEHAGAGRQSMQGRRLSKTDQFFGVGDGADTIAGYDATAKKKKVRAAKQNVWARNKCSFQQEMESIHGRLSVTLQGCNAAFWYDYPTSKEEIFTTPVEAMNHRYSISRTGYPPDSSSVATKPRLTPPSWKSRHWPEPDQGSLQRCPIIQHPPNVGVRVCHVNAVSLRQVFDTVHHARAEDALFGYRAWLYRRVLSFRLQCEVHQVRLQALLITCYTQSRSQSEPQSRQTDQDNVQRANRSSCNFQRRCSSAEH
nr:uncharacterized protein CFP56_50452 [Quercus suber]